MPYITSKEVKAKRNELKKAFPDFKLSVTHRHYSSIDVVILAAPIKLTDKPYESVNVYWINDHYQGQTKEILLKIKSIISSGVKTLVEDGDYGNVPTFYYNISIGEWDKPFTYTGN